MHVRTYVRVMPQPAGSPAMDHNGFVSSLPLYHQHMLNDCHDGRRGGTQTFGGPAGHLELSHLVYLARLQERNSHTQCILRAIFCHEIFTELYYLWVWWLAMHKPPTQAGSHLCNYLLLNKSNVSGLLCIHKLDGAI